MKIAFTIIVLIFTVNVTCSQSYKNAFKAAICKCIEAENLERELTANAYRNCFKKTLPNFASQIDADIKEEDYNKKFYLGQIARKDLIVGLQYEIIYSCTVYHNYLDKLRITKIRRAQEQAKESDLEKLNQLVALTPSAKAYFLRAELQYNLGNIKAAEADVNRSLEINPNKNNIGSTRHELLLLASIYTTLELYSKAVALYDTIYFGDLDTQVATLRALADIKAGGRTLNRPKLIGKTQSKSRIETKTKRRRATKTGGNSERNRAGKAGQIKQTEQTEQRKESKTLQKLFKIDK